MEFNSNTPLPVVVVGAGMSGLVALKSCLEEGLSAVCYDKTDSIGGIWKYRENGMSCMKTTVLNISKECTCYSDFPIPDHYPNYMNHAHYLEYLHMYADQFHLKPHINLQHEVLEIASAPNSEETGQWIVTSKNMVTGAESSIVASAVMICTGVYRDPSIPPIPGLKEFQGTIMHSRDYKENRAFDNKTVVVIGSGNSAFDVAVDVGRVATKLYSSSNRNTLIITRMSTNGYPVDTVGLSRFKFLLSRLMSDMKIAKFASNKACQNVDKALYSMDFDDFEFDKNIPVFNDELAFSILNGRVIMKNPVHKFTAHGVSFKGEEDKIYPIDAAIMATGFCLPDFNIIKSKAVSKEDIQRKLYKRVFPVNLKHPTMAFIGYTKFNGPMTLLSELQSRWVVQVFTGKIKLPEKSVMMQNLKEYEKALLNCKHGQNLAITKFYPYLEEAAAEGGVKPNLWRLLFTDPRVFYACVFGPYLPYHFRLHGPHPWDGARQAILTTEERVKLAFNTRPALQSSNKKSSKKKYAVVTFYLTAMTVAVLALRWQQIKLAVY